MYAAQPTQRHRMVSVDELVGLYPVSRSLIYREIRDGHLPHRRIAGRILLDLDEVDRVLRLRGVSAEQIEARASRARP